MKKITAALLAAVMALASCGTGWNYRVPKDKRQTYSETVNTQGVTDLDFKLTLFMWDRGINYSGFTGNSLAYTKQENGESAFAVIGDYLMDDAFCNVRVFTTPDQYRINFEPDKRISAPSLRKMQKGLSQRDASWQAFAADMKQAVLADLSNDEIDELLEAGYTAYEKGEYETARKYFLKASIADPGDEETLISYGNCLLKKGWYNDAMVIYSLMPESPIAQGYIQIAKQRQAEEARLAQERLRQAEEERRRQQEANWALAAAILNATAQGLAVVADATNNQSGGSGGSSSGGGQASSSSSSNNSSSSNSSSSSSNSTPKKDHDFCHGTGWVYKSDSPNYTGETQIMEWCKICQKNRYPHYHTRCTGCNGTGKVKA